ncbi:MAG: multicopper oxidase type 2 [Gammaproteobacteria bacterium]|jgi:FtsP/CotA-like multicopper oxidase with cupredoxin domain|nr:multicopper oxidase type 2 [Gammaproteobacteria bacterium]
MSFRAILGYAGFVALMLDAGTASAQLLKAQCPRATNLHPLIETTDALGATTVHANPDIKCQEISGGDGYATMGDGTQTYLFGFGPLSGIDLISKGLPGTQSAGDFLNAYHTKYLPGLDANNGNQLLPDPTTNPASGYSGVDSPNGGVLDAAEMMNVGVLAAQQPAPLIAINEDDELYLTLSNVGMIMRPDLFEQHTVHFHGYPNASSYFDGVPDASVAIAISGSMTYYYTAPDAGTYFFHCHITPPEHLQMGMVGQLYVRPRQDKVSGSTLYAALTASNTAHGLSIEGKQCADILCTGATPAPAAGDNNMTRDTAGAIVGSAQQLSGLTHAVNYAYNDGDGSTAYDVEYPIQLMGFDPAFHFVGMTFNPEDFSGMKDKYFMISGRSYPDTISPTLIRTQASDGLARPSQPIRSKITLTSCTSPCAAGVTHRALLRVSDLNVTEFHTLASNIPMTVIGYNARLLRDMAGNNLYYDTNSITVGGGESADILIKSDDVPPGTYFLYTTNLDHLANDAENVGGMMTEIEVK